MQKKSKNFVIIAYYLGLWEHRRHMECIEESFQSEIRATILLLIIITWFSKFHGLWTVYENVDGISVSKFKSLWKRSWRWLLVVISQLVDHWLEFGISSPSCGWFHLFCSCMPGGDSVFIYWTWIHISHRLITFSHFYCNSPVRPSVCIWARVSQDPTAKSFSRTDFHMHSYTLCHPITAEIHIW